jgi:Kef-type K+ transport system membrane component KefB
VVATAFTATSVGISVAVWQEMDALRSRNGELLIDIAELDDISAVILMALLFTVLPQLKDSGALPAIPTIALAGQVGLFLLKLIGFGAFCFLFSRYVEKPVTHFFQKLESPPDPMLTVAGIGFMIAAMADSAGFSMAIGAFFAGLIFSRDPDTVKMEGSFMPIYDFFSPFFFIGIGMNMDPAAMDTALAMGVVLTVAAIGGKFLADGLPVFFLEGRRAALLIGTSMIPRAEITMVIMQRGHAMGAGVVPSRVFNAMIVVSALTCLLAPFSVRSLLKRWPQESSREEGS